MSEPHDTAPHAPRSAPAQPQSASPGTPPDGGPGPRNEDDAAMDAYSRVVTTVAATLRPRVASLRVVGPRGEGAGSGVVFTDDGFLVTSVSPAGATPRHGGRADKGFGLYFVLHGRASATGNDGTRDCGLSPPTCLEGRCPRVGGLRHIVPRVHLEAVGRDWSAVLTIQAWRQLL